MRRVVIEADAGAGFEAWRAVAREALAAGFTPDEIAMVDASEPVAEALMFGGEDAASGVRVSAPHVPRAFVERAKIIAAHRSPDRWQLLYRLLWRLQSERQLLHVEVDADVAEFGRLEQQVRRDLHKCHAFVRFRKVEEGNREEYVAWYEPDHCILRLAAPFFAERFAVMRWTILTPDEVVRWEPETKTMSWGPGVLKEAAPEGDALEELWRSYYGAIFNPARVNSKAMRSEMPARYWKNLPELEALPHLMQKAEARVEAMVVKQTKQPTAAPFVPDTHTLTVLRETMPACEGCELYKHATQVVPGEGGAHARLMLVGEQPGDREDIEGKPFVGPAGKMLQRAMDEVGISAKDVFVTNAVKHFKFIPRGKFRMHQSPRMSEISACRPWLEAEMDAGKPKVILCLGASAAKSLLGGTFALMAQRGKMQESKYAERVLATVHPSAVLRAQDEAARELLYGYLRDDLAVAWEAVSRG